MLVKGATRRKHSENLSRKHLKKSSHLVLSLILKRHQSSSISNRCYQCNGRQSHNNNAMLGALIKEHHVLGHKVVIMRSVATFDLPWWGTRFLDLNWYWHGRQYGLRKYNWCRIFSMASVIWKDDLCNIWYHEAFYLKNRKLCAATHI